MNELSLKEKILPSEFDDRIIGDLTTGSLNSRAQAVWRINKFKFLSLCEQVKFMSWKAAGQIFGNSVKTVKFCRP